MDARDHRYLAVLSCHPVDIGLDVVLLAGCVLGAASIGLFYFPAAILLLVAGAHTGSHGG